MIAVAMMLTTCPNRADDCSICSGFVFFLTLRLNEVDALGAAMAVLAGVYGVITNTVLPVQSLGWITGSSNVLKS